MLIILVGNALGVKQQKKVIVAIGMCVAPCPGAIQPQRTAFRQHSLGKCLNTFDYFFLLHIQRFNVSTPLTLAGFGMFDVAKLQRLFELAKRKC